MRLVDDLSNVKDTRRVLIHEHVFCRVRGENVDIAARYVTSEFQALERLGVDLVVDTTTYVTPDAMANVETTASVSVACSAGYYTERYIDRRHRAMSIEDLTESLLRKVQSGVGRRRLRPLMLKCGSGGAAPSRIEERAIAAVSRVKSETGLPLQVHSCDGAEEQHEIISRYCRDSDIMFCHIEMGMKTGRRLSPSDVLLRSLRILDRGNYIYFNDFGANPSAYQKAIFSLIKSLLSRGYGDQLCIGSDSNWSVKRGVVTVRGVPATSPNSRKYSYIYSHTIPNLRRAGVGDLDIEKMCFVNGKKFILAAL